MTMNQILQIVSQLAILLNVAFAAFVAATPADHPLPWWFVPAVAVSNAVIHALPSSGILMPQPPIVKALLVLSLLALGMSACAGGNATLTACGVYDSSLFTLAGLRHEGKLSPAQVAAVDQARAIANPICMQATPPDNSTTLATVQSAADKLSATLAGVH